MATTRAEPQSRVSAEMAVYCGACRGWIGTVPAGTPWLRSRCINRRCSKYGAAQTIKVSVIR